MGSQWAGMGRDLLRIPIFSAAVDRCDAVLRPRGLDIRHILTTKDKLIFDNILNCFVAIAAVQVCSSLMSHIFYLDVVSKMK
jgi:fatty acid synthase